MTVAKKSHYTAHTFFFFLQTLKPDKPVLIMEYWVGWFDLWGNDKHHDGKSAGSVARVLGEILEFGASFNLYMFHGLFFLFLKLIDKWHHKCTSLDQILNVQKSLLETFTFSCFNLAWRFQLTLYTVLWQHYESMKSDLSMEVNQHLECKKPVSTCTGQPSSWIG